MILSLLTALALAQGGGDVPATSTVQTCYDGDTCTLSTGDKVRLRWVNTPELRPAEAYGIEARDAAWEFVRGHVVTLVLPPGDPRDGYGRVVAGLRLEDDADLSLHLLELGLGHVFVIPPDETDLTRMIEVQAKAREHQRGIWSTDRYQGVLHITSFHANAPGLDTRNVNGEYLRVANITAEPVSLSGFTIEDSRGRSWELSPITVPAGHTFEIHSGRGVPQADSSQQLMVFLNSPAPVWNNKYDLATIKDGEGEVVDAREHRVKSDPAP